jgi:hypothetical protein
MELAWHVNAGPPLAGIAAQTSGVAPGVQNVYSLWVGSHVVWQPTLKYWPLVSSVPQQTAPGHCAESEQGSAVSFPFSQAPLVLLTHE